MSVEAMAVVLNHSRATGTDKVVLLGIANHEGDGGSYPSVARLARYAGVNRRNLQKAVTRLVDLGEVRVIQGAGGSRATPEHLRTNVYEIRVRCPRECDRSAQHRMPGDPGYRGDDGGTAGVPAKPSDPVSPATPPVASDAPSPRVASDAGTPVDSDTPPVSPATPEPSLEPPTEPSEDLDPPTPLSRQGDRCAHGHRGGCRACGTSPRAIAKAEQRVAADVARQVQRASRDLERLEERARVVPSNQAAEQLAAAREAVAAARGAERIHR